MNSFKCLPTVYWGATAFGNLSIALLETNPRQLEAQNFDRTLLAKNLAQAYLLAFCNLIPTLFTFLLEDFLDFLPEKTIFLYIYIYSRGCGLDIGCNQIRGQQCLDPVI